MVSPMLELSRLCLVSQIPRPYLVALISASLNVKSITIGDLAMSEVDDHCFHTIIERNKFEYLQDLKVSRAKYLTILLAYSIVECCPNIRRLGVLEFWDKVTPEVIHINSWNWNLFSMYVSPTFIGARKISSSGSRRKLCRWYWRRSYKKWYLWYRQKYVYLLVTSIPLIAEQLKKSIY